MVYGVSNGYVADDVTWPQNAVRQYGRLSLRQLGFLLQDLHVQCRVYNVTPTTEGTYSTQRNETHNNQTINTKHRKSPVYSNMRWVGDGSHRGQG